jgi:NADH:ubiquinone oxidoreductase subunit 3 (subunit A)
VNFQVLVLLLVIAAAVIALVVLPSLIGRHARWRRRKQTAFGDRHNSVDLFQSRSEPPPPPENETDKS